MITYIILILERIAYSLFDTSTSYLFISTTYVKLFELAVGVSEEPLHVATLVGRFLATDQVSCIS